MPLASFEHVLILSKDMEATRDFYVDVLGLREGMRPPFPFPGYWLYLGDTACIHVAQDRSESNDAQDDYLSMGGASAQAGTGPIDHVAFNATGLRDILTTLGSRGVAMQRRTVPEQGLHQVFFQDPNGIKIELNFSAEEAALAEAAEAAPADA